MGSTSLSRHLIRVLVFCFILTPLTCLPFLQRQITTSASLPPAGSSSPKRNQPQPAPYYMAVDPGKSLPSSFFASRVSRTSQPASALWRMPGVLKAAAGREPFFIPTISATKVDSLITDNDSDTLADPGDTLRYTVTISNTGTDATGLSFSDTISSNTTLVGGSVEVSPVAIDDAYSAVGNVRIQVPAGSGVLANDFLGTPTATLTGSTFTSTNGGNVTLNTDGSFSYNPPVGFEGTDTFNYTVTNAVGSNTATVSITVSGMIWFINNALGTNGDGRLTSPFNSLSAFAALNNGTSNNPAANDNIFLFTGSGAYSATLTLLNGQKLIGQGADATLASITGLTPPSFSDAFPTTNGTDPTVTSSGVTVTLAQNNRIQGLTLGNATTTDISGSGFGTLTLDDTTLNGTGGALTLSSGTLAATFDSIVSTNAPASGITFSSSVIGSLTSPTTTITNPTQSGISIASSASGTFSFGNTTLNTSGAVGLSITGSAATINFQDLDIAPDSGVSAIGVSTFTGTLTSTTGTIACSNIQAISIAGTSTASRANLNMVLTSVSTSSATNGITLTNVAKASGATNSFAITGDGGGSNNASGGTITGSGSSNAGINLTSANDVSLGYLSIQNSGTDGILATSCQSFSLTRTNITDNAGTTSDEGIQFDNVSGTVSISNCSVTSSPHNHFFLDNDSGTLSSLSISNSTFDTTLSGTGNHGILIDANGTAVVSSISISNCTVSNNFSIGMQILSNGSASINGCNVSGNTITTNTLAADLSASSAANFTYDFNNNPTIRNRTGNGSHGLNTFQGCPSSGTLQGKIRGNTIGLAGVKESGSAIGNGIRVNMNGAGTSQVEVTNNIIREVPNGRGIEVTRRSGSTVDPACNNTSGLHKITITGNNIAAPTGGTDQPGCPCPLAGIYVESRDQKSLCAKISGNASYNPASFPAGFEEAYTLSEAGTSVFSLEGTQATASAQIAATNAGTPVNASAGISVVAAGTCGPALPRPDGSAEPNQTVGDGGQNHLRVWRDGGERDKVRQVTQEELDLLKAAAISRWATADLPAEVLEKMRNIIVSLGDLPIGIIAINDPQSIVVDYSAAGYGWFVDSSPLGDEEFQRVGSSQLYVARPNTPAFRKADLLTVIMRQLGHIAGLKALRGDRFKDQLMANMFFESIRRLPDASFDDLRRLTTEEAKVYAPASASPTQSPRLALGSSSWTIGQMTSVLPVFLKKTTDASPTFPARFGEFTPELKKAVRVIPATSDITAATPSSLPPALPDDLEPQKGTQRNRPPQSRAVINPLAGETVSQTIGTLPGGESVTIRFNVTVNNPLPTPQISPSQPAVTQVLNQGTVSGGNFSNVLTDDPDIAGAANPTTTAINQTTTVVTSSANPSGQGQSVTFTATVTGTGFQPPNGANVRFFDGTTLLGSGTLTSGQATFATSLLTVGNHNIVAVYDGAAGSNGSISNTLVQRILMPPQISKAFAAPTMPLNGTTTLTITITNPNTVDALTGVSVSDVLPAGLTVSDSSTSQCGGTLTTTAATSTISLTGATVAANGSCVFNVTVTATTTGVKNNTTGNVNSTNGGQGGTASASITVLSPPSISKAFGASTIPLNGTTTLTFTLTNSNPS
ncbi:MAG TPA: Ig-like domain repeat protein, partial [Acidobacteriota bacterium]|nr:Ig-like domain repeat protein [Acidobacteriota bacterium]